MKQIAMYLRLSMADADLGSDCTDESNSIENQRLLIHEFLKSHDEIVGEVKEYVDDGYSGLNFNRPGFRKMIEDAKRGLIGTIIVKDLSRFGRDYIGTGDYLEQILPALQVRVIAINSHYDSKEMSADILSIDVGIQNIINNMYSKDLSRKITGAYRAKWEAGENPSGHVVYGYYIDENHKIQIDTDAAPVVKLIFDLAEDGHTTLEIAESLNSRGYLSPLMYKLKKTGRAIPKNIRNPKEQLWSTRSVMNTIRNYDYTGARVHGKIEHYMVGQYKTRKAPKSRQIIVENDHPAIVSKEQFAMAQMAIKEVSSPKGWNSYEDAFSKKIRCGCCGNLLQLTRTNKMELVCSHSREIGSKSKCNTDTFDRRLIVSTIIKALRENIEALSELQGTLSKQVNTLLGDPDRRNVNSEIQSISDELARKYEDFANGRITRDMFIEIKSKLKTKKEALIQQEEDANVLINTSENTLFELNRTVSMGQAFYSKCEITPEIVDAFIEEVFVHAQDRIDIHFKTKDLYERALLEIQKTTTSTK